MSEHPPHSTVEIPSEAPTTPPIGLSVAGTSASTLQGGVGVNTSPSHSTMEVPPEAPARVMGSSVACTSGIHHASPVGPVSTPHASAGGDTSEIRPASPLPPHARAGGDTWEIQPASPSPPRTGSAPAAARAGSLEIDDEAPGRSEDSLQIRSRLSRMMLAATFHPEEHLRYLSCVNSNPSRGHTILLGFQHALVSLGGIVIASDFAVRTLGGTQRDQATVVQAMLFTSALNTLSQTLVGSRLPTVMGPSLAYTLCILNVAKDLNPANFPLPELKFAHNIRAVQGSLIMSSVVTMVLGYSMAWGRLARFLTPLIVAPLVSMVGLGEIRNGFSLISDCWGYGLPTLILIIACQYFRCFHPLCRSMVDKYSPLICIGIFWALSGILTAAGVHGYPKIGLCAADRYHLVPAARWHHYPYPIQWGLPVFRGSDLFGMMGAAVVSSAEFTGSLLAVARLSGATPPPCNVISRAIGLQGVGQLLSGVFGAPFGPTAVGANVGLLGLTRIGSRRVAQVSSMWMVFFAFGKFGAFFATIPIRIFGAVNILFYSIVAGTGLQFIQFVNLNSPRNVVVLGISFFFGLSVPDYFKIQNGEGRFHTHASWFNSIMGTILGSPTMVAGIVGMILDNSWEAADRADRGIPWWVPFQSMTADIRTMEFYTYPVMLRSWIASLRARFRRWF